MGIGGCREGRAGRAGIWGWGITMGQGWVCGLVFCGGRGRAKGQTMGVLTGGMGIFGRERDVGTDWCGGLGFESFELVFLDDEIDG